MFKKNLFNNIFILTISVFLIAGSFILVFSVQKRTENLKEVIFDKNKLLIETLVSVIEGGDLEDNFPLTVLDGVAEDKNINFLWIVNSDGEIYYADDPDMVGIIIDNVFLENKNGTVVKEIKTEGTSFPKKEKNIGLIVSSFDSGMGNSPWLVLMGISFKQVAEHQKEAVIFGMIIFVFGIIFIFFISFYFFRKINRPLRQMQKGVETLSRGDSKYKSFLKDIDKSEDVGNALNKMAEDLKKYQEILEESKDVLEIRVRARTRQLEELADTLEDKVEKRTKVLVNSREALLNILEDVENERRVAEEEKNKTLAIIENFADGLLVFNSKDVLILGNAKAEEFLKVKSDKIIGKQLIDIFNDPKFKSLISIFKKGNNKIFKDKLVVKENLILEITVVPIIKGKKRTSSFIILHDVTKERLIEKMKTEFVSLAAHQLRTPLSGIKWTLKMFLDKDLGKITKEQEEFLKDTYNSNEKMINLVNDLLNVTKIEEGKYVYKLSPTNIKDLVNSVIRAKRGEAENKGIIFKSKIPTGAVPEIMADPEKMKIVIDNIVSNAVIYTPPKGAVTVSLSVGNKDIRFSVKDTGSGIPKAQQERIFNKFFRGSNAMKIDTEGTGLGLFISKSIVEAHGGKIWFESEENFGTTFYLIVPIKKYSMAK